MITYNTIDVPMPAFRHRDITAWVKAVAAAAWATWLTSFVTTRKSWK